LKRGVRWAVGVRLLLPLLLQQQLLPLLHASDATAGRIT
jgi:hypothetical protein